MSIMGISAIGTWICLLLGYTLDPVFFLIGAGLFLLAATIWTVEAAKSKSLDWKTIFIVWAIPIILFLLFGFAFMYLPATQKETTSAQTIRH